FLGFLPKQASFSFQSWFGHGDHSQPILCFFGFFPADPHFVFEIFRGRAVVRLTKVRADAGSGSDQLGNQATVHCGGWDFLRETDNRLSKPGCALSQIENWFRVRALTELARFPNLIAPPKHLFRPIFSRLNESFVTHSTLRSALSFHRFRI